MQFRRIRRARIHPFVRTLARTFSTSAASTARTTVVPANADRSCTAIKRLGRDKSSARYTPACPSTPPDARHRARSSHPRTPLVGAATRSKPRASVGYLPVNGCFAYSITSDAFAQRSRRHGRPYFRFSLPGSRRGARGRAARIPMRGARNARLHRVVRVAIYTRR